MQDYNVLPKLSVSPRAAIFLLLFFLSSFAGASLAQTPAERHQKIQTALENKNFAAAAQELEAFRAVDVGIFELNNFDYLLGRIAEKRNDFATAAANYQSTVKRNSVLRDYALWRLSQVARASANLLLERIYLQQLLTVSPADSLLLKPAQMRLAQSFFESGDYNSTIQSLKSAIQIQPNQTAKDQRPKTEDREKLVLLGRALQLSGRQAEAREVFTNLIKNLPNPSQPDDFALAAARGLDELESEKREDFGKRAPQLPDFEHLRRALIYQFNRDFASAQLHYRAIVERYPNSPNAPDAILQLGRIASTEGRYNEAITQFEQLKGQFSDHPLVKDALNLEASAFARAGNYTEAIAHYEEFIRNYVDNPAEEVENAERPFLNIIDALRDAGRDADALEWIRQTRERFRGRLPAAQALFSKARIHLSQGDWNSAWQTLSELEREADIGNANIPGSTTRSEIAFLKAFCLEQLNRTAEAFNAYLAIPDGRNEYYGWRATERLKAMAKARKTAEAIAARLNLYRQTANQAVAQNDWERARSAAQTALRLTDDVNIRREMIDVARRGYEKLPAYKSPQGELVQLGRQKVLNEKPPSQAIQNYHREISDELIFLGLYDEAAPELDVSRSTAIGSNQQPRNQPPANENARDKGQRTKPEAQNFTLAVFYKRGDLAHKAVGYAEPLWRSVPADFLMELAPREMIELLYPVPYAESLLEFAPPREVDPRFVLSIMRQESRFRSDVKSVAAARGLMQFIPSTANEIARQLGRNNFEQDELYHPPTAVLFGSQYLQNIFRQFPQEPQAVAAAYNGGEANMMRWLIRSRSQADADRYVAEIQFAQSKDYVFKVLANYRVYQILYNERLERMIDN